MTQFRHSAAEKARRSEILEPWERQLKALRRGATSAHAALMHISDERVSAMRERGDLVRHIEREGLADPRDRDNEREVAKSARFDLAQLQQRIAELDRELEIARAAWAPQCALLSRCEEWMDQNSDAIVARV